MRGVLRFALTCFLIALPVIAVYRTVTQEWPICLIIFMWIGTIVVEMSGIHMWVESREI